MALWSIVAADGDGGGDVGAIVGADWSDVHNTHTGNCYEPEDIPTKMDRSLHHWVKLALKLCQ